MTNYKEELNKLQWDIGKWSRENFGTQPTVNPLLGVGEEFGELVEVAGDPRADVQARYLLEAYAETGGLTRSVLKRRQGIREGEDRVGDEAEQKSIVAAQEALSTVGLTDREDDDNPLSEEPTEAEADAVGDIIVYLADYCERRGLEMGACVEKAWEDEVKHRAWDSSYES